MSSQVLGKATISTHVTDAAMGIALVYYEVTQPYSEALLSDNVDFGIPYFSASFLLNVLLTLVIVIRLILHNRNIRNTMGTQATAGRLYKAIITMLI